MEEVFTSQSSAVARIMSARQALLQNPDDAIMSSGEKAARLERLERLLFDVRAGRTSEFTMPTANGEVRIWVSPD
ncbi:hypothetical protein [Burkholderia sp. Ac-20365]|uniref:hypothetical protein n=1 Tax=Burkholderia sp. Ac-20365 TaxID=2703897 RepID=UPI00197C78D3|nr:hypothetical protein [Burkholderia sp. Ac-20365]MBN3765699.1 hypothetical protein [Burkholderia sp. Ac-20365]